MNISLKEISLAARAQVWVRMKEEDDPLRRRRALRRVDRELEKGNFKAALSLVKQLQGMRGGLRGFSTVKLVPKKMYNADELELDGADLMSTRSLVDSILWSIRCCLQFALEEEKDNERFLGSLADSGPGMYQIPFDYKGVVNSALSSDPMTRIANFSAAGQLLGGETLAYGDSCNSLSEDQAMCLQHEAGHFLVGYLLGVLPKRYKVPSMDDLMEDNFARGKVEFLGFEFLKEVHSSTIPHTKSVKPKESKQRKVRISSKTLNRFLCVILGGLTAEHLLFGHSELLHSDVEKLDRVLQWMDFREKEADFQVKWAATNTVLILKQHDEAREKLAEAMALGKSIGFCIDAIESALNY